MFVGLDIGRQYVKIVAMNKTKDGYKILNDEWECYSRLTSLKKKPHKTHHVDYVSTRKSLIDEKTLEKLGLLEVYKTTFDS